MNADQTVTDRRTTDRRGMGRPVSMFEWMAEVLYGEADRREAERRQK